MIKKRFTNTNEAVNWVNSIQRFGEKFDLKRMNIACTMLGNPQRKFKSIHITGTNGKGSTSTYIAEILKQAGYKVGLFTSPYIVKFTERIQINGNYISDKVLLKYINQVYKLHHQVVEDYNEVITFFEVVTLISFLYYRDQRVKFAVYEVGLGGLLDATNVITPIISVLTNVSYDHTGVLGNTLESILTNKLGIVKKNVPLITTLDNNKLKPIVDRHTIKMESDLYWLHVKDINNVQFGATTKFDYKEKTYEISLKGIHQPANAICAIETINLLVEKKYIKENHSAVLKGLKLASIPGRLEVIKDVIFDGAHNEAAFKSLIDTVNTLYSDKYIKVIFTMMHDKDIDTVMKLTNTFGDEIHFVELNMPRCEKADKLYKMSKHHNKYLAINPIQTFHELVLGIEENELILVCGSLYLVSALRKEIY